MPREVISSDPNANVIEIRWGKDVPEIELSTSCPSREITSTQMTVPDQNGSHLDTSEFMPFAGWTAGLGRYEINRLIRILRRARDQAFGEDA